MRYEEFKALRLRVLQPEGVERFGIDAILLAVFASRRIHKSDRLLDLGTGSGIVALLLLARGISYAAGVEIYPPAAEAARENARINSLPLEVFSGDLREELPFPEKSFDLAVANPPFFPAGSESPLPGRTLARSDRTCSFRDVTRAASRRLKNGGRFYAVYRPERLTDALCAMREEGIEPKRLRPAAHDAGKAPFLILIEGKKGAKPGLIFDPLLTLDGDEMREICAVRHFAM